MEKLVFATHNKHKLEEIRNLVSNKIDIVSLTDLNFTKDIPETSNTLIGNAMLKAEYVYNKFGLYCFADDTGLIVDCLDGAPGVYSARYAGDSCDSEKNITKLLENIESVEDQYRTAKFQTVICLIDDLGTHLFTGEVNGIITKHRIGSGGFGYDSVFLPNGYNKTFAEMTMAEKCIISHRGISINKLVKYLKCRL